MTYIETDKLNYKYRLLRAKLGLRMSTCYFFFMSIIIIIIIFINLFAY